MSGPQLGQFYKYLGPNSRLFAHVRLGTRDGGVACSKRSRGRLSRKKKKRVEKQQVSRKSHRKNQK